MNNLFSMGLLTISVIALSGCKESVDLKSNAYGSGNNTESTSTNNNQTATNTGSSSIIVTQPGVKVVRVVNITGTEQSTQSNTGNNNNTNTGNSSTGTTITSTSPTNTTTTNGANASLSNTSTSAGIDTSSGNTSTTTEIDISSSNTSTSTETDTSSSNTITTTETDTSSSDTSTNTEIDPNTDSESNNTIASTANCEAIANPINPFVRVQLHYGLLSDAPFIPGELGGLDSLTVTEDAAQNATVLKLNSTIKLVSGQLITYVGINGQNRVAEIGEILADQVTITSGEGLETRIAKGSKISNFYDNPTHPNINGYKAMADFGLRNASPIAPNQTHALLGDSWFDASDPSGAAAFEQQLNARLPGATIFNEGIGGNTLCDLIERFDTDIAPKNPQYVWINSSINDYFNDVPASTFKIRMQFLISKVQAINATAIVFDSAPAVGTSFGGDDLTRLSNDYAGVVLDLLEELQQ